MSTQLPVRTSNGEIVYFEVEATGVPDAPDADKSLFRGGGRMGAADKVLEETVFSKAVGVIRGLVEDVGRGLMDADPRPDQVELEFSLGLGASGNVMIFKGDAHATFKLKLSWKAPPRQA